MNGKDEQVIKEDIEAFKKLNQDVIFISNFGRDVEYYTGIVFEIFFAKGYLKKEGMLIIAGSLNKLNKKGSTFFKLSGPPKLNRIIAFFI